MRKHSNGFKEEIKLLGRQLDSKIQYTINNKDYTLTGEQLISIVPNVNASLLKTIMKQVEVSSTVQIPKNTVINVKSGVKVNNKYEYIDFGNYIVKDNEWDVDTQSYKHLCCDNMLKTMIDYVKLDITYPITVRNYINAICEKCGLVFANKTNKFVNYNKNIKEDYFDYQLYTFRDILDYIAQLVGGFICINSKDELEVRYPTETNEVLDKSYLNDKNVTIKQKYGPINHIIFSRGDGSDNIYRKDNDSINKNGETIIKIKDNPFLEDSDREQFIDGIYEKLNGLYYYVMDIQSTGIMFLEVGDLYDFKLSNGIIAPKSGLLKSGIKKMYTSQSGNYKCLLLNDEISISSGLSEMIYTEESEVEINNYTTSATTDKARKNAMIETKKNAATIVLKANSDGKIVQVELNGNADEKGSLFKIQADNIELTANDILNLIAGNELNLTSKNIAIKSDNFSVDKDGNLEANNAILKKVNINGGNIELEDEGKNLTSNLIFVSQEGTANERKIQQNSSGMFAFYGLPNSNGTHDIGCSIGTVFQNFPEFNTYNYKGDSTHDFWSSSIEPRVIVLQSRLKGQTNNIQTVIEASGIQTPSLTQTSLAKSKKNFEKLKNGLDIVKATDIYKYHLKTQKDDEKKHIGFVIGNKYNYSHEITSLDENKNEVGVDTYSMIAVAYKAIQEQQEMIEQLQNEIKFLKEEINEKN